MNANGAGQLRWTSKFPSWTSTGLVKDRIETIGRERNSEVDSKDAVAFGRRALVFLDRFLVSDEESEEKVVRVLLAVIIPSIQL